MIEESSGDIEKIRSWNRLSSYVKHLLKKTESPKQKVTLWPDLSDESDPWTIRDLKFYAANDDGWPQGIVLNRCRLERAKFYNCDLKHAQIQQASLNRCEFRDTTIDEAFLDFSDLSRSSFRRCSLVGTNANGCIAKSLTASDSSFMRLDADSIDLEGTGLMRCRFDGAQIPSENLESTRIVDTHFDHACLTKSRFIDSHMQGVSFAYACLENTSYDNVDFESVTFNGDRKSIVSTQDQEKYDKHNATERKSHWLINRLEKVWFLSGRRRARRYCCSYPSTILDNPDLRNAARFDANGQSVRGTKFSPHPTDPYSIVRTEYTGSMMLFHIVALAVFFAPLILRTAVWVSAGRIQHATGTDVLPLTETRSVFAMVMGYEPDTWLRGWAPAIPAFVMLLYNILRAVMTWWLGKVRDAEERSNHLPMIEDYWWCYWLHKYFMRWIFWFAVASFAYNLIRWMSTSVAVPV